MGAGNFHLSNAHTVYIPEDQIYPKEEEMDDRDYRFDHLQDCLDLIKEHTSSTFVPVGTPSCHYYQDGCLILAESGLFCVTVKECDHYLAVNMAIREVVTHGPRRGLAEFHHWPTSRKFFDSLSENYKLRQRSCAWMSSEYIPSNKVA